MNRIVLMLVLVCFVEAFTQISHGNALDFDGVDDYVSLSIPAGTSFANGFTYSSWVKYDSFPPAARLVDFGNGSESNNILIRNSLDGSGTILISVLRSNAPTRSVVSPQKLVSGTWTHVAFTIAASATDSSTASIYVNGQLAIAATITMPKDTARSTNYIGKSNWDNPYFNGAMDEISIWNKALTQPQIDSARIYGLTGTEGGLLAYYTCNQGTASGNNTGIASLTNSASGSTITNTLTNFAMTGSGSNLIYLLAGSGTNSNPYLLYTYTDLKHVADNVTATYQLMADIDATPSWSENSGKGFEPIGRAGFRGTFKGHGHVIKNLYINQPDSSAVGLFAFISNGSIDSLRLEKCTITGNRFVGGIAGGNESSSIRNCFVTGAITGSDIVGGLVGYNFGSSSIVSCGAAGTVRGTLNSVGGLVGDNNERSTISSCYATSTVSGTSGMGVGGLAGTNSGSSFIDSSYATGSVTGTNCTGGLVGINQTENSSGVWSQIQNCYATGSVSGGSGTGGLVGANLAWIQFCYATGSVSGSNKTAGLAGQNWNGTINNCYWNLETTGQTNITDTVTETVTNFSGFTTAQMKAPGSFPYWNFSSLWNIRSDSTYPGLRGIDNAPFAFADTITVNSTVECSIDQLLANDCDLETKRENLVLKLKSLSAGSSDSLTTIQFPPGTTHGFTITAAYAIGEKRAAFNDTLWGNIAQSVIIVDTSTGSTWISQNVNKPAKAFSLTITQNSVNALLSFAVPVDCDLTVAVYTISGRHVATLVDKKFVAGIHTMNWNTSSLASGLYAIRMFTEKRSTVVMMTKR